jgi:hypothetical protein
MHHHGTIRDTLAGQVQNDPVNQFIPPPEVENSIAIRMDFSHPVPARGRILLPIHLCPEALGQGIVIRIHRESQTLDGLKRVRGRPCGG